MPIHEAEVSSLHRNSVSRSRIITTKYTKSVSHSTLKSTAKPHWRVLYTRPRAEKKVEERLVAAGIEVFLPMRTSVRQWSDRRMKVQVPLFPGYIFAHVNESERLVAVQQDGVVKTVSFGSRMAVARPEEIDMLRKLQAIPEQIEAVAMRAVPKGADVVLTNGPLAGVRGQVVGHPRAQYLLVEAASIHQAVRVHVPADWVMRIAA